MSTRQEQAPSPPVGSRDDLVAWIAAGSKPAERWRIGTEHEKFLFHIDTLKPVPYAGPRGVRADAEPDRPLRLGPIREAQYHRAQAPEGEGRYLVSLEPGGQFELSGAPISRGSRRDQRSRPVLRWLARIGPWAGFSPD
jgi:glutamate--cysteine ligase